MKENLSAESLPPRVKVALSEKGLQSYSQLFGELNWTRCNNASITDKEPTENQEQAQIH